MAVFMSTSFLIDLVYCLPLYVHMHELVLVYLWDSCVLRYQAPVNSEQPRPQYYQQQQQPRLGRMPYNSYNEGNVN